MNLKVTGVLKIIPMILTMGIIFFLSHQSSYIFSLPISLFSGSDKIAHLIIYCMLALSTIYAFSESFKKKYPSWVMVITAVFCLFYGLSDEFHQSFIPGRFVSIFDVAADFMGAVLGCILWVWHRKKTVKVTNCTSTG